MRELKHALAISMFLLAAVYSDASGWKWIGPGAGKVQQIIADRRHPAIWYTVNENMLYRSSDFLKSWRPIKIDNVYFIEIHPFNSQLFILTNESGKTKLWALNEGNDSAKLIASFDILLSSVVPHPLHPEVLYGIGFAGDSNTGVSTDGGHHWQLLRTFPYQLGPEYKGCSLGPIEARELLIPAFNSKTIYANADVNIYCPQAYGEEYSENESWVSSDSGTHWKLLEDRPSGFHRDPLFPDRAFFFEDENGTRVLKMLTKSGVTDLGDSYPYLQELRSVPRHPNELLGRSLQKFVRSIDGGKTWKETDIHLAAGVNDYQATDDPFRGIAIATYGGGVYERNDNHGWQTANRGFRKSNATRVLADSANEYSVIGEDLQIAEFLYRSADHGKTWTDLSMKSLAPISAIAQDPFDPHHIVLACGRRILSSYDDGNNWHRSSLHSGFLYSREQVIQFDPKRRNGLFVTADNSVYKSEDGGLSFTKLASLPYPYDFSRMIIDPNNANHLYFATDYDGIYKSEDGGKTIHPVNDGLPRCCPDCAFCALDIIALGLKDTFLASMQNEDSGVLYRTVNGAKTWTKVGKVPGVLLYSADPMGNHLYTAGGHFAESTDGGLNWTKINLGRGIFVEWLSDPSRMPIYAATNRGVYVSEN
jgi:photosystem II stability/assembly factor-like uncharacterized protein